MTSVTASSTAAAIGGVRDSIGPVNPNMTPTGIVSWADALVAIAAIVAMAMNSFLMTGTSFKNRKDVGPYTVADRFEERRRGSGFSHNYVHYLKGAVTTRDSHAASSIGNSAL